MNKSKQLRIVVGLILVLVGSAAFANEVVKVTIEPNAVYFSPLGELEQGETTLTISGPEDCYIERNYKEREVGVFKIFDDNGELIPDGEYSYQVVFRPTLSPQHQAILASARKENDPKVIKDLRRQGIVRESKYDHGTVRVFRGEFVFKDLVEEGRSNLVSVTEGQMSIPLDSPPEDLVGAQFFDFLINDDLIVDGSACIGFDCVDGESFGFDTIRVKENNLRIKFDDTSVAASFPRNDWQLTANDSANGGANKFSIDDISGGRTPFTIEANARSHSLYVDDGGRIGNRTSTPSTEIHTIDGDTPTLRLQQDGSSGFAPQTFDVAGNETNFFVRDVTNGSTLPFRIRPGAPTSSIFVDADGDIGLGTATPSASLHVRESNGTAQIFVEETNSASAARGMFTMSNTGGSFFTMTNTTASTTWFFTHEHAFPNRFLITGGTGQDFALTQDGDLTIAGTLVTSGPSCSSGCDDVLREDYDLETIDEHAQEMLSKQFLPAVGPTVPKAPMNLSEKTGGILNELEKAHLYIVQLHKRLERLEARLDQSGNPSP